MRCPFIINDSGVREKTCDGGSIHAMSPLRLKLELTSHALQPFMTRRYRGLRGSISVNVCEQIVRLQMPHHLVSFK